MDPDFIFVTNSLHRIDVLYLLSSVESARNYEVADILCLPPARVLRTCNELSARGIINSEKIGKSRFYSLTDKGKKIVIKLKEEYHGIE